MTQERYEQAYQHGFVKTVRLLRSRGASRDDAEDVAQAAWLKGWQKLEQLRDEGAIVGWINTIAVNRHRRASLKQTRDQVLLRDVCGQIGIDSAPLDAAKILNHCRPRDRVLFEQQLVGLTTQEIAATQGVTATAIRIRFLRARRAIRVNMTCTAV